MPMYSVIEYNDNYSKKHLEAYGNIVKIYQLQIITVILLILMGTNATDSFNFKAKYNRLD